MLELHVFDVDLGQSIGVRLPNGRWCLFDAGAKDAFHPIDCIVAYETVHSKMYLPGSYLSPFHFLKATISHLHGDHLYDYDRLFKYSPQFMRSVAYDQQYLADVTESSSPDSLPLIRQYLQLYNTTFTGPLATPDYGGAQIREISLPVELARRVGGTANNKVNNSSIITRITCYNRSILICGDMEAEAWEWVLSYDNEWMEFVSNTDILIAPHHGHRSGYSTTLMNLARPKLVVASVNSGNENVDTRYSGESVSGFSQNYSTYKLITTRKNGNITVNISPPFSWNVPGNIALALQNT